MKKLFLTAIITLMSISLGLYAQEKQTAQTEPKVKLLWEKEFEDTVRDFSIGELSNGETYVKVLITKNWVHFYDEKMSIKRRIDLLPERDSPDSLRVILTEGKWKFKRAGIALGSKFIGVYSGIYDREAEENIQAHYEVYDANGKLQWETELIPAGVYPKLSPNGQFLVATHFWIGNKLWFFNRKGLVKEVEIPGDRNLINSRSSFDEASNFVIASGDPKAVYVLSFDSLFSETWRYNLGGISHIPMPKQLSVSPGKYISVVYCPDPEGRQKIPRYWLALLDKKGRLLWKKPGYYISRFSQDEETLLLIKLRGAGVSLHETKTNRLIYEKNIKNEQCLEARFFSTKPFILVLMETNGQNRYIALWDMTGKEIFQLAISKNSTFHFVSDNFVYLCDNKVVKKYKLISLQ